MTGKYGRRWRSARRTPRPAKAGCERYWSLTAISLCAPRWGWSRAIGLCDPDAFSKEASIELARQMVLFDPKLDTRLVRLLPGRDRTLTDPADCATIERVLELLEVVSFCARIVPARPRYCSAGGCKTRA